MDFNRLINSLISVFRTVGITDIIDVGLITILIYNVLLFMKRSRTFQLLKGVVGIFFIYILATQRQLKTVTFLIESLLQVGFIAMLVVFQPELRRILEQFSNGSLFSLSMFKRRTAEEIEADRMLKAISGICDGMERMSEKRTGALIVMENFVNLDNIKSTGTTVNADITPELIGTIFYDGSPLHDGAVVVHNGRIMSAGCVLPLSNNFEISKEMGTRHRAALGLSEVSDAICLVVSEETGTISYAKKGDIKRNLTRRELYNMLDKEFVHPVIESSLEGAAGNLFRRKSNEK